MATFELQITDIANGGLGVGRHGGKTYFVPYTLPGETITARLTEDKGRFAFAEGLQVLDSSNDRILPHCPHFGPRKCGGCHWQHIDYTAQLALKTDLVADQLSRVGGFDKVKVPLTLASPEIWGYRHETVLYPLGDGKLGFHSSDGKTNTLIEECHIITPDLLDLLGQVDIDLSSLTHLTLRENRRGDRMLVIGTHDDEPPQLELDIPNASVNFLLTDHEPANLIGSTYLSYHVLGRDYRVTAGSFFRPNLPQIETLLNLLQDWLELRGNEAILDLYAGVGVVAGFFAPHTGLITCVDSYPPAMTDADENLSEFDHISIVEGHVADVLADEEESYDIAIIDPPPQGLDRGTLEAIETVLPPRLVYISSDPASLARDAKNLHARYGYQLDLVQPIDFEPHTYRVVSVAHLHRK